jgi:hypothetical protein
MVVSNSIVPLLNAPRSRRGLPFRNFRETADGPSTNVTSYQTTASPEWVGGRVSGVTKAKEAVGVPAETSTLSVQSLVVCCPNPNGASVSYVTEQVLCSRGSLGRDP